MIRFGTATLAAAMMLTACNSLPSVEDAIDGDNPFEDFEDAFDPDPVDISGLGDPPSAEPGTTVVEFDGQQVVYALAGSINPRCEVTEERFQVSMENADGDPILFDGAPSDRGDTGWQGSPSFDVGSLHHEGDSLSGHVVVEGDIITYQGTITIIRDRSDINSWEDTLGSVTANCSRPGGDPTVTIDGVTHELSLVGADNFECEFSETEFLFDIDRQTFGEDKYDDPNHATEGIQFDGRLEGDRWIGAATIRLGPDNYSAFIPEDLAGIEIGPDGATWTATFTHTSDVDESINEEVEVTLVFPC